LGREWVYYLPKPGQCKRRPASPLVTRIQTLPVPTEIAQELWPVVDEMLCHRLPAGRLPVRIVGMGVSGLDDTGAIQGLLFDAEERQKQARPAPWPIHSWNSPGDASTGQRLTLT
jgi:hypothetical protein